MEPIDIRFVVLLVVDVLLIYQTYLYWFRPDKAREQYIKINAIYGRFKTDPAFVRTPFWLWMNRVVGLGLIGIISWQLGVIIRNAIRAWW